MELLVVLCKIRAFSDNLCRDARVVNGYDSNFPTQVDERYHMVSAA
jgi:hypothetical protein